MGGLSDVNIIASGLNGASNGISVVGNNLANTNTIGFKSGRIQFGDLLTKAMGQNIGSGVSTLGIETQFTQGGFKTTTNPLDFAVNGNGFFVVKNQSGSLFYTRDGEFSTDANGNIVNAQGMILQGATGNMAETPDSTGAMPTSVQLGQNGILSATYQSGQVTQTQLVLAKFNAPTQLQNAGNNLYSQTNGSGAPTVLNPGSGGAGTVMGSTLEVSNVSMENEFANMITLQNAFQAGTTVLNTTNEMFTSMIAETES